MRSGSLGMTSVDVIYFAKSVVLLQDFAKLVVRQRDDRVAVVTGHGLGGDHGVDHGLFRRFDCRLRIAGLDFVVEHFHISTRSGTKMFGIGGGEGEEDVARAVAGDAAVAGEAKRDAARQALQLMRK